MGVLGKLLIYGAMGTALMFGGYNVGYSRIKNQVMSEAGVTIERQLLDNPVISNPETEKKYIVNFNEAKLEEITEDTYRLKERERLIKLFK